MKVQAFAGSGVGNVILDFVSGYWLFAQHTANSRAVPRIDVGRQREWQTPVSDALHDAAA